MPALSYGFDLTNKDSVVPVNDEDVKVTAVLVLGPHVDGSGKGCGRCRVGGLVEVVSKVELGNDEHHLSLGLGQLVQRAQDPSLTPVITNVDFLQNRSIISGQVGHGWLRHVVGVTCQRHFLVLGQVHVDGREDVVPGLAPPPGVTLLYPLLPQCLTRVGGKGALPLTSTWTLTWGCGMSNLKTWRYQIKK